MSWKRRIVRALNTACTVVDAVAYRPAVVRLTMSLPRWWSCQLAHLSMWLDDRWGTEYWEGDSAPAAPQGLCEACQRRASWLYVGGYWWDDDYTRDEGEEPTFLATRAVHLCGWCHLDSSLIETPAELEAALARARERSIAWRWRWIPA